MSRRWMIVVGIVVAVLVAVVAVVVGIGAEQPKPPCGCSVEPAGWTG